MLFCKKSVLFKDIAGSALIILQATYPTVVGYNGC